jgi:hypothetical protein
MSQSKIEDVFFYRKEKFSKASENFIPPLFTNFLKTKPEQLEVFWDGFKSRVQEFNIIDTHEKFIENQCNQLKKITLDNMAMDLNKEKRYLKIYDKNDPEVYALVDARPPASGELRAEPMVHFLEECKQKEDKNKNVYEVLSTHMANHNNPAFIIYLKMAKVDNRAENVVSQTIDSFLANPKRDMFERVTDFKDKKKYDTYRAELAKKHSLFLATLDKANTQDLKEQLKQDDFQHKQFSDARAKAIEQLLDHRSSLLKKGTSLEIKNKHKASNCHFCEELIQELYTTEPKKNESFKDYVKECTYRAESKLSEEERVDTYHSRRFVKLLVTIEGMTSTKEAQAQPKPEEETKSRKISIPKQPNFDAVLREMQKTVEKKDEHNVRTPWRQGAAKKEDTNPKNIELSKTRQPDLDKIFDQMQKTLEKATSSTPWKNAEVKEEMKLKNKIIHSSKHREPKDLDQMLEALKQANKNLSNSSAAWKEGKVSNIKHRLHDMLSSNAKKEKKEEKDETITHNKGPK